ncbi:AMP-binding protein [Rhabdochlamydiaceae symbiont of Dictyostelium giganteum]|uniref:AMP-binding protein n=1 Tax=Rhabdochlamydiaceae symbiont of Dictyostelium giganteum TaxID=3342349 RepID=UPI00384B25DA
MFKKIWVNIIYYILRMGISIRYRLKIRGLENLHPKNFSKTGGVLFLPNHPAEIDPIILSLILWDQYRPHPLVVEQFYYLKGASYFQKLVGAIPIPDMSGMINKWKQKKVQKCFDLIAEGLKKGENYLIYPAGRLKVGAEEVIGGASFAHNILQECPDTNVVLVRTTGLWGSRFSRALTGSTPDFGKVLWEGVKIVFKNLIFLTPRREVTIEFESLPQHIPVKTSRIEFNQSLEKWYNLRGPEPLTFISDRFYKHSIPQVKALEVKEEKKVTAIDPDTERQILQKIGELAKRASVQKEDRLARDLGLDSLDMAELQTFVLDRYETTVTTLESAETVGDVLSLISHVAPPLENMTDFLHEGWPKEESRPGVIAPQGSTIQEAFLRVCDRMDHHSAAADRQMGAVSYRRLKLIALTLSHHFRHLEDKKIGVLLPSTTMTYVIMLALLLADKTPVMLNWTTGTRSLNQNRKTADLHTVLSSRKFLEHLADGDLGEIDDLLLCMEDVKESVSLWSKLKGMYGLLRSSSQLLKDLKLEYVQPEDPAVILFTSGTESLAKAVPLSHKNILSNQTSGISCIHLLPSDVMYGGLPPFHSFGFSITGLLPLLTGLRVYYAPDPTQYTQMAQEIKDWRVSILCSAPTFLQGLVNAAKPQQLKSLRLMIGGAEKCPPDLFQKVEKLGITMLEGYGVTECSPVVSLTRIKSVREGVGKPIPGVKLCVVHPETLEKIPSSEEGEICIFGSNVFKGYLGDIRSPFIKIDGKEWYRSGDRGYISESGCLMLTGRLRRFVKIGGEMVSLIGLEEELLKLAHTKSWMSAKEAEMPSLAVVAKEPKSDKPLLILFTTFLIDKDTVNEAIRESGFGRIVRLSDVKQIKEIPVTATGKIQHSRLEEMV